MRKTKKQLNNELINEVCKMKEELNEQRKIVDFLSVHDKEEIVVGAIEDNNRFGLHYGLKYLYQGKIKELKVSLLFCASKEVVANDEESAILKVEGNSYYRLDKKQNVLVDISDIYKEKKEKGANK